MDTVQTAPKRRKIPKWVVPVVGYSISALSLVWVFSKFPFAQLGEHLRTMDWTWVAIAVICELAVYFVDAWRWMAVTAARWRTQLRSLSPIRLRRPLRERYSSRPRRRNHPLLPAFLQEQSPHLARPHIRLHRTHDGWPLGRHHLSAHHLRSCNPHHGESRHVGLRARRHSHLHPHPVGALPSPACPHLRQ